MKRTSTLICLGVLVALAAFASLYAVQPTQLDARLSGFIKYARVRHVANSATVYANEPRPLAQAVRGLSGEYGWAIDYEDPPYYSKYDLVDDTDPRWRKAHPNEKGVVGVAGRSFHTAFLSSPNDTSTAQEARILDSVVSDYNKSGNPGRFIVRNEGDGRFSVVGVKVEGNYGREEPVSPVLDTPVTIPSETRNASLTIRAILAAASATAHVKLESGTVPLNIMHNSQVTVGGQNIPARELLAQVVNATQVKLCWHLYYDADEKMYVLNLPPVVKGRPAY